MTNYEAEMKEYEQLVETPEGQAALGKKPWKAMPALPIAPLFPVDALPKPLADMATAVAHNQSVPVDLPAVTGLAVLAACACGRVIVHVRKGWDEPCNLFLMPIIRSGGGKTPTFNAMGQMLLDWQCEENKRRAVAIEADAAELAMLVSIKDAAVKKKDRDAARQAGEDIAKFHPTRPLKRFISGNTTPEQMIAIMSQDDNGAVSVLDDDGGQLLDLLAGQYQTRPNLDPYLKGFSGSTIMSERKGGSSSVAHAYLTALIMLQPSAFDDMLADPRAVGRGFLARFLFCLPEPSFEIGEEPDIPDRVIREYNTTLQGLLDIPKARYILDGEARRCFMDWRVEATRKSGAEWAALFAYDIPKKLISSVARIAGLLKLMEEPCEDEPITAAMMRDAITIAEYFAAHMLRAFEKVSAMTPRARDALSLLVKNGESIQREREIKRVLGERKMFKAEGAIEAALDELEKAGNIRRMSEGNAGRPVRLIELHPDLLPHVEEEII